MSLISDLVLVNYQIEQNCLSYLGQQHMLLFVQAKQEISKFVCLSILSTSYNMDYSILRTGLFGLSYVGHVKFFPG